MRIPFGVKIVAAITMVALGGMSAGAGIAHFLLPEFQAGAFTLLGGVAVFAAGMALWHRLINAETRAIYEAEHDELREALEAALAPPRKSLSVLPHDLLTTGDNLAGTLEIVGEGIANALKLLQTLQAQTGGVDTHLGSVLDANEKLRADNALLDTIHATVRARRPEDTKAGALPWLGKRPDLGDHRSPVDFAPPAVREADRISRQQASDTGLKAILEALDAKPKEGAQAAQGSDA